ncbi:MAG: ABC transporter ATP-binding protein [Saprospiraceae bacterium]
MNFNHILQALQLVWTSSKKWTILLLIAQLMQAILPLINLYLIKLVVDSLTETGLEDFQSVLQYVLLFGLVQLLIAVIQNYEQLISETQQQLVTDYMSTILIDKATSIDISYYENPEYHDTFHLAQQQAMFRPVQILRNLTDLLRSGLLLLSLAGLLVYLHWAIAIILLCFALPIAGVKWYYSRKLFEWEKRRINLEREAHYLNQILTTDTYAKEVRIFNLKLPLKKQFVELRKLLFGEKLKIGKQRARAGFFARSAEIIAMTLTYGFIAWRTFNGAISIGDLVMYFQAFQKGQAAIQQSIGAAVGLYNNRLFLSHLFELLKIQSLLQQPEQPLSLPPVLQEGIKVEQLNFTYPNTMRPVLKNINLELKKGQVIALVGENGSGKTTLVKLLCRLYDSQQGKISWDNVDIKTLNISDLRKRISVIYQDFAKYFLTIQDNIQMADWEMPLSEQKIRTAARQSGAATFIEELPHQYEHKLSKRFKKGIELSGGQWQKIALTRAFYKDADLIVLDEPSSAIDPIAEADIFNHFRKLATDKILVLVTHRLYNLKIADKIVVLKNGEIVESGTHDE